MNWAARPQGYDTKKSIATTYAALTMRSSGVILALFVVYHLLHLTAGAVGFHPGEFHHLSVYHNVVAGFSVWYVSLFYIVAMAGLCLHLDHGIWSMFQTLGWNNARSTSALQALSRVVALVVFGGFIAVPIAVLAGWLRRAERRVTCWTPRSWWRIRMVHCKSESYSTARSPRVRLNRNGTGAALT